MSVCYVMVPVAPGGRIDGPIKHVRLRAETAGRWFVVNRYYEGSPSARGWTLTHRPTGWRLATFTGKSSAKRCAGMLREIAKAHGVDWSFTDPVTTKGWPDELKKALGLAVAAHGGNRD